MRVNEASWDRVLRVVVGLGLLSLVFAGPHTPWGWVGLLPLLTGAFGYCPAYTLMGVSTRPARAETKGASR